MLLTYSFKFIQRNPFLFIQIIMIYKRHDFVNCITYSFKFIKRNPLFFIPSMISYAVEYTNLFVRPCYTIRYYTLFKWEPQWSGSGNVRLTW